MDDPVSSSLTIQDGLQEVPHPERGEDKSSFAPEPRKSIRVLIVDDDDGIRRLLTKYLSVQGFDCVSADSGNSALALTRSQHFDAALADVRMPVMSGIELLQHLKAHDPTLAVLMITGNDTTTEAVQAMKLGADDYILKPFAFDEVLLGLGRALERRRLKLELRAYQTSLEQMVAKRTAQLQQLFISVMRSLIFALEAKDPYTNGHSRRVAWLAKRLGALAGLQSRNLEMIEMAAIFHDLGKIGISEAILLKPHPLTPEEYLRVQAHPEIGARILQPMKEFQEILPIVKHHHERYDGSGYPSGLMGAAIPLGSRIISVIDTFDALTTARPYATPISPGAALEQLILQEGKAFDPDLVELFVSLAGDADVRKVVDSPDWTTGNFPLRSVSDPHNLAF